MFRGFERFSEVFQRPSQSPSQSAIFLSELRFVLPLIVLPLKLLPKRPKCPRNIPESAPRARKCPRNRPESVQDTFLTLRGHSGHVLDTPKPGDTPGFRGPSRNTWGTSMERKKTDKEKSHKGIWRSDALEASQGQTRDVPGHLGHLDLIYV